jgi:hypothetical protein
MITIHNLVDAPLWGVAIASGLYRFMPPPEKFADWPKFQGGYKLAYTFVSWIALNK